MKRFLIVAAICVIAAPAFAGSDLLPVKGLAGTRAYDLETGQQSPVLDQTRGIGPSIWAATTSSGYSGAARASSRSTSNGAISRWCCGWWLRLLECDERRPRL